MRSASATASATEAKAEPRSGSDSFEFSGQVPRDETAEKKTPESASSTTSSAAENGEKKAQKPPDGATISEADKQVVAKLQSRDREVRAHEAAHQAAGGGAVGGASYSFQQGPDGKQYAIGGEVSVDLSTSGGSPEATIAKMARVRAAATAPAEPSGQDLAVAAAASAIAAQAQQELRTKTDEVKKTDDEAKKVGESDGVSKPAENTTKAIQEPTSPTILGEQKTAEASKTGEPESSADASTDPLAQTPVSSTSGSSANERVVADRAVQRALSAYRAAVAGPTLSGIDQHV